MTFKNLTVAIGGKLQLVEIYAALRFSERFSVVWKARSRRGSLRGILIIILTALKVGNNSKNDDNVRILGLRQNCGGAAAG